MQALISLFFTTEQNRWQRCLFLLFIAKRKREKLFQCQIVHHWSIHQWLYTATCNLSQRHSVISLYSWTKALNKYLLSATETKLDHGLKKKSLFEVWCTNVASGLHFVSTVYVYFSMDIKKIWFDSLWNLQWRWFLSFWVTCAEFHHWFSKLVTLFVTLHRAWTADWSNKEKQVNVVKFQALSYFIPVFFCPRKPNTISVKCQPSVTTDLAAHLGGMTAKSR